MWLLYVQRCVVNWLGVKGKFMKNFMMSNPTHAVISLLIVCATLVLIMGLYAASVPSPPKPALQQCINTYVNWHRDIIISQEDYVKVIIGCRNAM